MSNAQIVGLMIAAAAGTVIVGSFVKDMLEWVTQ